MPLRRSPLLTPASLAARRANALKSTGPRTERGKQRAWLNGLLHGGRSRLIATLPRQSLARQLEFAHIYAALHKALVPRRAELGLTLRLASGFWWLKRTGERLAQDPGFRAEIQARRGWLPPPLRTQLPWRDGRLMVTVSLRRGRGPTGLLRSSGRWNGYGPIHAELKIYAVRPGLGWRRLEVHTLMSLLASAACGRKGADNRSWNVE
jgi:hypothetical protein